MGEPRLKPCPFCGDIETIGIGMRRDGCASSVVMCDACDSEGPCADTPESAAEKWNERAQPSTSFYERDEAAEAAVDELFVNAERRAGRRSVRAGPSMRECLERAVKERGQNMKPRQFEILMANSMRIEGEGFSAETLWRALRIACGEDGDG